MNLVSKCIFHFIYDRLKRLPDAAEIPREWNPADLSSIELKIFTSPNLFNSPAAIAKGADLLPGHSIKF